MWNYIETNKAKSSGIKRRIPAYLSPCLKHTDLRQFCYQHIARRLFKGCESYFDVNYIYIYKQLPTLISYIVKQQAPLSIYLSQEIRNTIIS